MNKFTRRNFIEYAAKGTAGIILSPIAKTAFADFVEKPFAKSRVVVTRDDMAASGASINQSIVQIMVDAGIRTLTGIDNVSEAWLSLFPGITQSSSISIKVNCIARQDNPFGLASHPQVINCIINGLTSMQVEGNSYPQENIIIWDRSEYELIRSGFTINRGDTGVKCFGTRYEIMNDGSSSTGYSTTTRYNVNGINQYLSNILIDNTDYLINTCLLKDHSFSGVTLSLKNHYGTCWNPYNLHAGKCDPYIAALNVLEPIRQKQVINICDAIYGIVSGGPMGNPQVTPKSLIFSKDPVAHDRIGTQILRDYGTPMSTINRATHINTAANPPYSLGISDPNQIELININNPSTGIDDKDNDPTNPEEFRIYQNYPNPFNNQTTISYQLFKPASVKLEIYNIQGQFECCLVAKKQASGFYQLNWNGKNSNNISVPSGIYLGHFKINDIQYTMKMQLIK